MSRYYAIKSKLQIKYILSAQMICVSRYTHDTCLLSTGNIGSKHSAKFSPDTRYCGIIYHYLSLGEQCPVPS